MILQIGSSWYCQLFLYCLSKGDALHVSVILAYSGTSLIWTWIGYIQVEIKLRLNNILYWMKYFHQQQKYLTRREDHEHLYTTWIIILEKWRRYNNIFKISRYTTVEMVIMHMRLNSLCWWIYKTNYVGSLLREEPIWSGINVNLLGSYIDHWKMLNLTLLICLITIIL